MSLTAWTALFLLASRAPTIQPAPTVEEIRVEGNRFVPDEAILVHLRDLEGRPLTASLLSEALHRLWDTDLFEDIEIHREGMGASAVRLIVKVVEKPFLRNIRIEGDLPPPIRKDLLAKLEERGYDLRPHRPLTERDAGRAAEELETLAGPDYEVSYRLEPVGDGRVDLLLSVKRHPLPHVETLTFSGNHALESEELRKVMHLKPSDWTSWLTRRDRLRPAVLEADIDRIRSLYESRGFIDVEVGPSRMTWEGAERVRVTIPIEEGPRYHLGRLSIEPGFLMDEQDVRRRVSLSPGDTYDRGKVRRVAELVTRRYQNAGYAAVRVDVEEDKIPGSTAVDVRIAVHPGIVHYIGTIEFQGNTWSRDRNLRQYLATAERARFSLAAVEAGDGRLMALGAFERVRHEIRLREDDNRVDVIYHITERKRFDYLVGGNVTGVEGVAGTGTFMARDLVGRGETWSFEADLGNRLANLSVGFGDPFTLGHRLVYSVGFERRDLVYPDDTSEKFDSLAIALSGPVGSRWQFQTRYLWARYELGSQTGESVPFLSPFDGRRFDTSRMTFAAAYEGRDRVILATRGTAAVFGGEVAGGVLGGDLRLFRTQVRATRMVALDADRRHLIELRAEAASVWPFAETEAAGLPRSERLFLGGEENMRGFDVRAVGPEVDGTVAGGDTLVYGSFEYQYELFSSARLVGFFDLGNVYARDLPKDPALPALRFDAGAELRVLLPFLSIPFRMGYGFNLDPLPDENQGRFFVALSARF